MTFRSAQRPSILPSERNMAAFDLQKDKTKTCCYRMLSTLGELLQLGHEAVSFRLCRSRMYPG